jgi:voltage-gated potassium channel Kch
MALIVLTCVNIVAYNKFSVAASVILTALTFAEFLTIRIFGPTQERYIIYFATNTFFLFIMTICVIYSVAKHQMITIDTLLGAICGYLLIGLTWSHLYLVISSVDPAAFSFHLVLDGNSFRDNVQHFIYFSYITLTTVGYGDIVPSTDIARAFSWLEAVIGQIYLTVWISQLVAMHIAQRIKRNLVKK